MQLITQRSLIKEFLSDPDSFWDEWRQKAAAQELIEAVLRKEPMNELTRLAALAAWSDDRD